MAESPEYRLHLIFSDGDTVSGTPIRIGVMNVRTNTAEDIDYVIDTRNEWSMMLKELRDALTEIYILYDPERLYVDTKIYEILMEKYKIRFEEQKKDAAQAAK